MLRTLLVVAVAAFAGFAPAQDLAQRRDAVREFRTYFQKFREPSQKVEAVRTLETAESPEAAAELLKLLDHEVAEVRAAALEVLGKYRATETFQALLDGLPKISDPGARARGVEVLGQARLAAAVPVLIAVAKDPKAATGVKYEVARALGRIGQGDCREPLAMLLADRDALVRMAASDAVGTLNLTELGAQVVPLLADDAWQVQTSAVKTLATLRSQDAITPLIALMRKGGRLKEECADALFRITTYDFGADPDAWDQAWQKLQAIGWRIPTAEELEKAKESRKRTDAYYGKRAETTTFSGITTTSTRILFIIDQSGSMDELVVEREKFQSGYRDFKKLTIVKTELLRTIDGLGDTTFFNIVAFASDLRTWKDYLTPANIVNRAAAKTWVSRLEPIGGQDAQELAGAGLGGAANLAAGKTNTHKALMHAFGIDPDKEQRGPLTPGGGGASLKNKLDTVFFLSDGRPSTGKLIETREILADVRKANETFKIVFHTIAIGDFEKDFLRSLAQDHGGVFVDLGR